MDNSRPISKKDHAHHVGAKNFRSFSSGSILEKYEVSDGAPSRSKGEEETLALSLAVRIKKDIEAKNMDVDLKGEWFVRSRETKREGGGGRGGLRSRPLHLHVVKPGNPSSMEPSQRRNTFLFTILSGGQHMPSVTALGCNLLYK